jgi:hypothetical protein
VAVKDKNFDCIRKLPVAETRSEHFDKALADGKVCPPMFICGASTITPLAWNGC